MKFWMSGTTLDDPVIDLARLRCMVVEHHLNIATTQTQIDAAIHELNMAESQFNERLAEIRDRYSQYGVIDWERSQQPRAGRRQRNKNLLARSTFFSIRLFNIFGRDREIAR